MPPVQENADPGRGTAALRSWPLASVREWLALDRVGSFLAGWLLPFALVLYLGLKGGGYDQVVYGQVGIIAWWIVVLGAAVAVLPLSRISTAGWVGFGLSPPGPRSGSGGRAAPSAASRKWVASPPTWASLPSHW